ncbi:MAG TPA: hypothetical protein VFQ45_18550 [Longimicrobium sp.]|nr:hypothetical protein [Longimicrobium sp.]
MVAHHDHFLRGARFLGGGAAPRILKRTDQEFIPALLAELRTEPGRAEALKTVAADREAGTSALRLHQPVHRVFHLAVVEALCSQFGNPRVDPKRVESAGLVVRRIVRPEGRGKEKQRYDSVIAQARSQPDQVPVEAWMKDGDRFVGWVRLTTPAQRDADPDPERRPAELRAGHRAVTAELARRRPPATRYEEVASSLFVAPPDACKAAGATLLYGLVPLASSDRVEKLPEAPKVDGDEVFRLVPECLLPAPREGTVVLRGVPDQKRGGGDRPLALDTTRWTLPELLLPEAMPLVDVERDYLLGRMADVGLLRGLGAFDGTREGQALIAHLNQVVAWDPTGATPDRRLGDVLAEAAALFEQEEKKGLGRTYAWQMPREGPYHQQLRGLIQPLLDRTVDNLTSGMGRYDRKDALYQVRAFVRLRRCDACPPELVWSGASEPFRIVPWYEGGGPPVKVQLPEAKLSELAKLKPNVAFQVPASVQNLLGGMKVKKPMDVERGDLKLTIDWICGFSIPLITLCAFIVLSIFLSLLNIIFWWLPFIKICIPLPKITTSERT